VVGLHPYPNPQGTCPTVSDTFNTAYSIWDTEEVMRSYGDATKPIWLTEFAWAEGSNPEYPNECSSRLIQDQRLTEALTYKDMPGNVTEAFWYLSDREPLEWPGTTCPAGSNPSWECDTYILNDKIFNYSIPSGSDSLYCTLKSAPPDNDHTNC
jgi:Glycosyl hydrolase catalytic core